MQKNNQLERTLKEANDDQILDEQAQMLTEAYSELGIQIRELNHKEKELLYEINEILSEKENLATIDKKEIDDLTSVISKYKYCEYIN